MLVLSRKRNESIIITVGDVQIEVMLIEIRGDKARIGIEAPKHVSIHREEIHLAIQQERAAGASE